LIVAIEVMIEVENMRKSKLIIDFVTRHCVVVKMKSLQNNI